MKNVLLIALLFVGFIACNSDASKQTQSSEATTTAAPVTTDSAAEAKSDTMISLHGNTFSCPMHPEETSAKAGDKCSKCGMALVEPKKK